MSNEWRRNMLEMAEFSKSCNFHAVVAGGLNLDQSLILDREPENDGTARILKWEHGFGGHAGNAACALKRIGGRVTLLGSVGEDPEGQQVIDNLRENGVGVHGVHVPAGTRTGKVIIPVGPQRHFMLMDRGANDVELPHCKVEEVLADRCDLLMAFDPPLATIELLTELRKDASWPLIWNPGGILVHDPAVARLVACADVLILNRSEFATMFPGPGVMPQGHGRTVIRTEGGNGCSVFQDGKVTHVPPFPVRSADETGAGDVFTAAFSFAFLMKRPVTEAAQFACAAAALSTRAIGARGNLPGLEEILGFATTCQERPLTGVSK